MSAITLQFDTAADLESALLDALQNNEGHVSGIAAYVLREQSRDAGGATSGGQGGAQKYDDVLVPFVAAMRKELHANTRKGDRAGWLAMDANTALLEVYWHAAKLSAAVKNNDGPAIQEHSADVANMAMMVLDICGGLAWVEVAADRAQRSGVSADPLPLTDTYVQPVPDKCDRITWRGQYYHLPVSSQSQPLVEPTAALDVDLPDRVIDQLMHDAGVSLMEPWSEQEMYDFANTVKREVLARVPSKMLATSPQHQVKKGEPS